MRPLGRSRKLISLDITPVVPLGRQLIQSYGARQFRVAGQVFKGSILLTQEKTLQWSINDAEKITFEVLAPLFNPSGILIVGCGARFIGPPEGLRASLKGVGMSLEWMDTGAACRTYNVLLIEERVSVAALIAVD